MTEEPFWHENSRRNWRQPGVIVPDYIVSHRAEQVAYFVRTASAKRTEYTVDVMGGASGAQLRR